MPSDAIAILQVDIEGYEYILFAGLMDELADESLPLVIHFERKVMLYADKRNGTTTRVAGLIELLRKRGYAVYDDGEDLLALRI